MSATRLPLAAAGLVLLLQACASMPPVSEPVMEPEPVPVPVPELTLNLPVRQSVDCVVDAEVDYTFLEKGFSALVAGDHIEAVQYFQRYRRLESSPEADWEAGIAIAYDSMLPQSPFYSPQAARKSYHQLARQPLEGGQFHEKILMMRDALATFVAMEQLITDLQNDNATLTEDLAKREEALKRLRALTLGQKGAAQ